MKELSFKELLKKVNEEEIKVVDYYNQVEKEYGRLGEVVRAVQNKVQKIIEEYGYNNFIRVYDYANNIYLCFTYRIRNNYGYGRNEPVGIKLNIKRTTCKEKSYSYLRGYDKLYKFKELVMDEEQLEKISFDGKKVKLNTLLDFVSYNKRECQLEKEGELGKKVRFEEQLESEGIDFEKFANLITEYKKLSLGSRIDLFEEFIPEESDLTKHTVVHL